MKRQGDGGDDGLGVQVQAAGEGRDVGQVRCPRCVGLFAKPGRVAGVGAKQDGKVADKAGNARHLRTGAGRTPMVRAALAGYEQASAAGHAGEDLHAIAALY